MPESDSPVVVVPPVPGEEFVVDPATVRNADLNTAVALMLWRHDYGTTREPYGDRAAEEEFTTSHLPLACRIVDMIRPVHAP